jgi:hypothetical protein
VGRGTAAGAPTAYVCEEGRTYLKTVDRRETWPQHPLPVERILTVGMDVAAAQQGHRSVLQEETAT